MKDFLVVYLCLLVLVTDCFSAPALISQVGESFDESSINNDTNPDPCYIAGSIYYHGQQISRHDECEFCLCVDGEMFCYWQCPDEEEEEEEEEDEEEGYIQTSTSRLDNNTPATDSISSSSSTARIQGTTQSLLPNNSSPASRIESTSPRIAATQEQSINSSLSSELKEGATGVVNSTTLAQSSTDVTTSTKDTPISCFVLGVEYKLGESLPHNTGTCLECKCGSDGRLTCSPNDCVGGEPQDDMFMSHHPEPNSLDMFDVDMF